jgi:hypothetical protein
MARRSELVKATADALRVEEKTVQVCARHLREAGLIRQKGRGRSAAHMAPSDATNLLLGVMTSSTLQDAPYNVRAAREAAFNGSDVNFSGVVDDSLPPFPFLHDDGRVLTFGEALDSLFDEIVRCGDPIREDGLPIANIGLRVERPGLHSAVEIHDEDNWSIKFERQDPRLDDYEGQEKLDRAKELFRVERGGMEITTRIGHDEFMAIGECLRGYEPADGETVIPPYEEAT